MSTSAGTRASRSMAVLPTIPACMAVPQATRWMFLMLRSFSSLSSGMRRSGIPFSTRGLTVAVIAAGCSWISFSMKWG